MPSIKKGVYYMNKVYACLAGEWVCLNDDPDSKISEYGKLPYLWWKEGAPIYSPCNKDKNLNIAFMVLIMFTFITKGMIGESTLCLSKL